MYLNMKTCTFIYLKKSKCNLNQKMLMIMNIKRKSGFFLKNAKNTISDKTVRTCATQRVKVATKQQAFVTMGVTPDGWEVSVKKVCFVLLY